MSRRLHVDGQDLGFKVSDVLFVESETSQRNVERPPLPQLPLVVAQRTVSGKLFLTPSQLLVSPRLLRRSLSVSMGMTVLAKMLCPCWEVVRALLLAHSFWTRMHRAAELETPRTVLVPWMW